MNEYDIMKNAVWPQVLQTLDSQLAFVFSTTNYRVFNRNFAIAKEFKRRMLEISGGEIHGPGMLIQRFNL